MPQIGNTNLRLGMGMAVGDTTNATQNSPISSLAASAKSALQPAEQGPDDTADLRELVVRRGLEAHGAGPMLLKRELSASRSTAMHAFCGL
jgi:hypothetical protein